MNDELKGFRPMLGADMEDLTAIRYPVLASYKLDGIRAFWWKGKFYSRTLKPIPNEKLHAVMAAAVKDRRLKADGWDGELVYGVPHGKGVFNRTTSAVMSVNGPVEAMSFYPFDNFMAPGEFRNRIKTLQFTEMIVPVRQVMLTSAEAVTEHEERALTAGYEGLILRCPFGAYKMGRSTVKEQGMLKVKRFADAEVKVIGFEERLHNANQATVDHRGYTKRTSHQAHMVPMGTLGALVVDWNGQTLRVGTGFTDLLRKQIWTNQKEYVGKIAKISYLPIGMKDLPRHPVFIGWPGEGTY